MSGFFEGIEKLSFEKAFVWLNVTLALTLPGLSIRIPLDPMSFENSYQVLILIIESITLSASLFFTSLFAVVLFLYQRKKSKGPEHFLMIMTPILSLGSFYIITIIAQIISIPKNSIIVTSCVLAFFGALVVKSFRKEK